MRAIIIVVISCLSGVIVHASKILDIHLSRREIVDSIQSMTSSGPQHRGINLRQIEGKDALINKELLNYYNVQYYGTLYVGSQQTEMQLIFDTGSSWLWLPSKECGNDCPQKSSLFDNNQSLTYKKVSSAPTLVAYGGGSVWGYKS